MISFTQSNRHVILSTQDSCHQDTNVDELRPILINVTPILCAGNRLFCLSYQLSLL
jgi:hypothetical protein